MPIPSSRNQELLSDLLFRIEMINNDQTMPLNEKKETFLFFCSKMIKHLELANCIALYHDYISAFNQQPKPSFFAFIYRSQKKITPLHCCYSYLSTQQKKPQATKTHKYFLGYIKATVLNHLQDYAYKNEFLDIEYVHTLSTTVPILAKTRGQTSNFYIKVGLNKGYQGQFNQFYKKIKPRLPYYPDYKLP